MKYKNIVFDFGNVLGTFDPDYVLGNYQPSKEDFAILSEAFFKNWAALDAGTIDYKQTAEETIAALPEHLKEIGQTFYSSWFRYLVPIDDTWNLIRELKKHPCSIYLLSNASTCFAEHAKECYPILDLFDGIVFSAPIKMAKPEPDIYHYLFDTYHLCPKDCFFIDDLPENIATGKSLGMNGIVFTGNINEVKEAIGL